MIKQSIKALEKYYQKILNQKKQNLLKLKIDKALTGVSDNSILFNLFFLAAEEVLDTDSESSLAS